MFSNKNRSKNRRKNGMKNRMKIITKETKKILAKKDLSTFYKYAALSLTIFTLMMPIKSYASEIEAFYVSYESSVNKEMTKASYWQNLKRYNDDYVMLSKEQVIELNEKILHDKNTLMYDLENMDERYNALTVRNSLLKNEIPTRDLYINGNKIDNKEYFGKILSAIRNTGYTSENKNILYAVCTKSADMKAWPTNDIIGYSADDCDDEMQSSSLQVNEPFIIKGICKINNKTFYYGFSNNCPGWVDSDNLAITTDKNKWLDTWKVDVLKNDFLVVCEDKVVIEPSLFIPEVSNVSLSLGTILKLVPKDLIPKTVGERGVWHNYVVYLPIRNKDGYLETRMALIPERYKVSVGFLTLNEKNIMDVAFSCLGSRYGWGGMLDAMDCSLYVRRVYRCFGFELPRNTTAQGNIPYKFVDMSMLSDDEKKEILDLMPQGTSLYIPGHTMIYIGKSNDNYYTINASGSLVDSNDENFEALTTNTVLISPLSTKRVNKTNWLSNVKGAVCLANCVDLIKDKTNEIINNKLVNEKLDLDK